MVARTIAADRKMQSQWLQREEEVVVVLSLRTAVQEACLVVMRMRTVLQMEAEVLQMEAEVPQPQVRLL